MEVCLRVPGLSGAAGEVGEYSPTASKGLQLVAEESGAPALLFRPGAEQDAIAEGSVSRHRTQRRSSLQADLRP